MEQEFEKPELQPETALPQGGIAMPGPGERMPMPAGPGTARRQAGEKSSNAFGLAAAAILTAGLAAGIVFRGDLRRVKHDVPAQPPAVQVIVKAPLAKAPPAAAPAARVEPPSELPSLVTSGSPVETAAPAPGSFSSPQPFFSSEEDPAVPKIAALQPYNNGAEPARQPGAARPVLPAANRLTPRLQPSGGQYAAYPAGAAAAAPVSRGVCTSCKNAVSGTKTTSALQGGETYAQHEIGVNYGGVCDGKYLYDYTNLTSNMTIGMKIVTSGGEAWTFTLKPGEKTSIKSSTEFTSGTFESYRTSEVIN
jgi:hypothetical protein